MRQRPAPCSGERGHIGAGHDQGAKFAKQSTTGPVAFTHIALSICSSLCTALLAIAVAGVRTRPWLASLGSPAPSEPFQPPHVDVLLTIYSYDRPADLLRLLMDVDTFDAETDLRVAVHVIDDNSLGCVASQPPSSNFYDSNAEESDAVEELPLTKYVGDGAEASDIGCSARLRFRVVEKVIAERQEHGWRMFVSHYRHGRRRYWHLIRMAHQLARFHAETARYFIFLPDDVRLASRFFDRATVAWDSITDARKLTMMMHIEESREHAAVWTDQLPEDAGDDMVRIGWVESGNFVAGPELMTFLNWSFPRVPIQRWVDNPPISSGVGATLSELIHGSNRRMYRGKQSLVAHVGVTSSKMNAAFRDPTKPSHVTLYFVDGDAVYKDMLRQAATVVVSIASTWNREAALHAVVASLATQVDHVHVYLNGYDVMPSFLNAPYITALLSGVSPRGDIGDIGKFYWANEIQASFHLTADDDILYPDDYVQTMLSFLSRHKSPSAVGVHGINIRHELLVPTNGRRRGKGYYGSREVFMGIEAVPDAHNVHILGTGTMLYRVADIGFIDLDKMFPTANMADIWFGIRAQQLGVPLVTVPHDASWLRDIPGTFQDSIYTRSTTKRRRRKWLGDREQTEAAIAAAPWKHHPPVLAD